jgi:hypothetical protein
MTGRRLAGLASLAPLLGLAIGSGVASSNTATGPAVARHAVTSSGAAFTKTERISRVNLVNGVTQVVDRRTFSVTVGQTQQLRNRQEINVSWTGAHPTGGIYADQNSELASYEEYPVVLMMCRGEATATSGKNAITPETCWTQTAPERIQTPGTSQYTTAFPPFRLDLYGSAAQRSADFGVPNPYPKACEQYSGGTQYWVPFIAASGQVFDYGPAGCAGLPPEAADIENTLAPGNTTYGVSNLKGDGSAKFVITTAETNASLGCSDTVPCSLVVIPIMGISCDPAGDSLPPADRPPSDQEAQAFALCSQTGFWAPGAQNFTSYDYSDPAVSGQLWWSASNWRNRIMVPLTFAPPSDVCSVASSSAPVPIYGSYLLLGATQQWAPHFCLNPKLFTLEHVIAGEPEAQGLLQAGAIDAVFQGTSPQTPFSCPQACHVVQAPTAVTGFAIVFDIVNKYGQHYTTIRLDARLLAKLLTESYSAGIGQDDKALQNPVTHKPNPFGIAQDPEFQALNPDIPPSIGELAGVSASTLLTASGGSDAIWALTSYINADPEARAWLNGKPDPWGMVVNPKYKHIKLPVTSWPLLDTYVPPATFQPPCVAEDPTPWLSLVASPVAAMSIVTLDLQFDDSESQTVCNSNYQYPSWGSYGVELPGETFILGLTSLADAERYGLPIASLETQGGSTSHAQFKTGAGRSFAAPTTASLHAAAAMMEPDNKTGSWTLPYTKMRTEPDGKSAYPGTMLISTDVPTSGLATTLATDYGEFLSFVAAEGQHPGLGTGQLPPGYLPMTAANGEASMVAYTQAAAADVTAQNSKVPSPSNPRPPVSPSHSPSPSTAPSPSRSASPSPSATTSQPAHSSSGSASRTGRPHSSATASTPAPTPSPTTTQPITTTADVRSPLSAELLPLVLLGVLILGTAAFGAWQLWRPRAPK